MIYCVWYPPGGFGHFINAILTVHGTNFVKNNNKFILSPDGSSHDVELVVPKYQCDPENYIFDFDSTKTYSVLIDNGINNESDRFKKIFPDAVVIKICYTDKTWPIVVHALFKKAMNTTVEQALPINQDSWPVDANWAQREKYFLFLRDNELRFKWKPSKDCFNLLVDDILDYEQLLNKFNQIPLDVNSFKDDWELWRQKNWRYLQPSQQATNILELVKNKKSSDLYINDIWTQALVNYYIWLEYQFEVPHNDYADWFTNTKEIVTMLENHGVIV